MQLTDLPNEVLTLIVSFLDTRTVLHLTCVCRRLRAVVGDPTGPQWSVITWRSSNRVRDTDGFKYALRWSKKMLKQLSLYCLGHHFRMSTFVQPLTICTNLQSITLDGVIYTEHQIGKVLDLPELHYLYLDTCQLGHRQSKIIEHVFGKCHKQLETLCIKFGLSDHCGFIDSCISFWAHVGYVPADLRLICRSARLSHKSQIHTYLSRTPATRVSYLSMYNHCHRKEFLRYQYQISPGGVVFFSCSDMQLSVASAANGMISVQYLEAPMQGNFKFSDICCNVGELDLSGNDSLTPRDLQKTFAACPNLLCLSLSDCGMILSQLNGLDAIATSCLKLRALNLSDLHLVESVEKLWRILARMSSLKVLSLSSEFLPQQGLGISMPKLSTLSIHGRLGRVCKLNDKVIFLASMTSLKVFELGIWCEIGQNSLCRLLQAHPKLTHLSLYFDRLVLPANCVCYSTLRELFINDLRYGIGSELVNPLVQCKSLKVLMLRIGGFDATSGNIRSIATSIPSLALFHIYLGSFEGEPMYALETQTRARVYAKSVISSLKGDGRVVDLNICDHSIIGNLLQFPVCPDY